MSYLIVGLGNPGRLYQGTRHNVGFRVVQAWASSRQWVFASESGVPGRLAQGMVDGKQVFLLLPSTFMNRSGEAVKAGVEKWKVPLDHLLIVSDDVALPLGSMRLRSRGSSGGHNGHKSIEAHLGTQYYARLKVGVGDPQGQILADYVLEPFSKGEEDVIEESIKKALSVLDAWVLQGLAQAMHVANARKLKEEGEENG